VLYQLAAISGMARTVGARVSYIKPHGALYNRIAHDPVQAQAVVDAVVALDPTLPVLGLPGSEILRLADAAGLPMRVEAFTDRAYTPEGALVSRRQEGAVIHDPAEVAARSVRMATEGTVIAIDGSVVRLDPDSLCLHSDTPGAVGLARAVRDALEAAGVAIRPVPDRDAADRPHRSTTPAQRLAL
jgi:UPF0271 protein